MRRSARTTATLAVAALLWAGLLTGCDPSDASPSSDGSSDEADPIPVETLTVGATDFADTFEVPATAEPVDEVTVGAESSGRILSVNVEEGDAVPAGTTLAQIETDIDTARINQLENQLEAARREYERTRQLVEDGVASQQELDQAETTLEDARLALQEARIGLDHGRIDSPISGVVQQRFIDGGEYTSPGEPVVEIVDYDQVVIEGHVPERRVRHIQRGDTVSVRIPALDMRYEAEVTHRAVNASPTTGTYRIEVTLDNDGHEILPGMSARLELVRQRFENAVIVPREAVLQGFSRSEAMVLPGDAETDRAELRVIELGPSDGPNVVVTDGLEPGDRLIVRGHRGLVNSALVTAVDQHDSIQQMRTGGADVASDDADDQ